MTHEATPRPRYHKGSTAGKKPRTSDSLADARSEYDVIVVGSGLGGLTAANVLGRAGYRVCVLEQHYNFGGYATWFKRRGGHVFDVSMHAFPFGLKKSLRRYWSTELADRIVPLKGVAYDNPQFSLETSFTREDFIEKLVATFDVASDRAKAFFAHLGEMKFYAPTGETVGEMFERFFPGRNDVQRFLMEPVAFTSGSLLDDPSITYGIVISAFARKGMFTIAGGTSRMIRSMRDDLTRKGAELYGNAQVERIVVEEGRTRGVVANGRFLAAPVVISNANVVATVEELVGAENLPADFVERCRAVRQNTSTCQVFVGLERGAEIPYVGDLRFTSTRPTFDPPSMRDLHGESQALTFYYPEHRPGSKRFAVTSTMNASWDDWNGFSAEEYEAAKERLIEGTLEVLDRQVPGIREKVGHMEAATPRTLAFYAQHPRGTSYGTRHEGLKVSQDLPSAAEGLFHAGSVGIIMSGWLGVMNYGALVANGADAFLRDRERHAEVAR